MNISLNIIFLISLEEDIIKIKLYIGQKLL